MKIEKVETHYSMQLKASEYDYLNVVADTSGRIKIKFLDERWRTPQETIEMLKEIIGPLAQMEIGEVSKLTNQKYDQPTKSMTNQQKSNNKKGIDWTKDNVYDAIGRPDLKPKEKSEMEWEKEFNIIFGEMLLVAMGGGDIGIGKTVIKDLIKRTLVQSRQQFAEEIEKILPPESGLDTIFEKGRDNAIQEIKQFIRAKLTKE